MAGLSGPATVSAPPSLRSFARPFRRPLASSVVAAVIATAAAIVPLWAVVQATTVIVEGDVTVGGLVRLGGLAVVAIVVHYVAFGFSTWIAHVTAYRLLAEMRLAGAAKLGRVPLGRITGRRSGELKTVLVDDIERLEVFIAHGLPDAVSAATVWLALSVWMFVIDWRLALAAVIVVPLALGSMNLAMRANDGYAASYMTTTATMNSAITETIVALPVVRSFVRPGTPLRRVDDAVEAQATVSAALGAGFFTRASAFYVLIAANAVVVVPVAAALVAGDRVTTFDAVFFVIVAVGANAPLVKLFLLTGQLLQLTHSGRTVAGLLAEPELADSGRTVALDDVTIVFDDVTFGYDDDHQVLHGVSFSAVAGEVTAIVGPSGAGKTTIARLLNRSWDAEGISIGGVASTDMALVQLAATVTVVAQEPFLFSGTIAENIRMGRPSASDAEVVAAARAARVDEFADGLPQQLDSDVGEAGARLSGGQAQRVSIARTLLADTPVVVLDEATAYADPDNEWVIQRALGELAAGRTLIVIAHRLDTIVDADRIVVLADGIVEAIGDHPTLLCQCRRYRQMWDDWQGAVEPDLLDTAVAR